jgi:rRNA biogenesis protein RRP5
VCSEAGVGKLSELFTVGKVVRVRIISIESETSRILASIRQAAPNFKARVTDITGVEIGNVVEGVISEIHKDNAILTLQPSEARAILSLSNLANHRKLTILQLRDSLKVDEKLDDLVVVSRNAEKGFVIVANRPTTKPSSTLKQHLSMNTIKVGQVVVGRVIRHGRNGAFIKLSSHFGGTLHPTDASDNYEAGIPFPAVDSILKAVVIEIDAAKKHVTLSTRGSKMFPDQERAVADREIKGVGDLKNGETIRGFIKSVAEHGLFVTLGRGIDARVQIKELFDEVGLYFIDGPCLTVCDSG